MIKFRIIVKSIIGVLLINFIQFILIISLPSFYSSLIGNAIAKLTSYLPLLVLFNIHNSNDLFKNIRINSYHFLMFLIIGVIVVLITEYLKGISYNGGNFLLEMLPHEISDQRKLGLISILIISPFFEELIFRKIFIDLFESIWNSRSVAVIISTLLFAFVHFDTFSRFVLMFLFGLIMSMVYLSQRSWLNCFISHSIYNASYYILFFLYKALYV
jgi:membrane protease YdiL (CAAX protease family)